MGSPTKQDIVLELFFNSPRHWHFEEIRKKSKLSRGRLNHWLNALQKGHIIRRVKVRKKMPYYVSYVEHPSYRSRKRLFALDQFRKAGLLDHLQSLAHARAVVLFGSMVRSDWYKDSDIDIFVLGDASTFEVGKFESRLGREIQVFEFKDEKYLKTIQPGLLKNMLQGYLIKGMFDFVQVIPYG